MPNSKTSTQTVSSSTIDPDTYITLGPAPADEPCAQIGHTPDFETANTQECQRYLDLIQALHPQARLAIMKFGHDFGTYYEVVALYCDEHEEKIALEAEANLPTTWE